VKDDDGARQRIATFASADGGGDERPRVRRAYEIRSTEMNAETVATTCGSFKVSAVELARSESLTITRRAIVGDP
jgi:hypothetical protein